jgi:hypothetical protein
MLRYGGHVCDLSEVGGGKALSHYHRHILSLYYRHILSLYYRHILSLYYRHTILVLYMYHACYWFCSFHSLLMPSALFCYLATKLHHFQLSLVHTSSWCRHLDCHW